MHPDAARRLYLPSLLLVLIFACAVALAALPFGEASAASGTCVRCGRTTNGYYSYEPYYGTVCYEPTCTQDGLGCFVCSECGNTNRPDTVPALGHNHQFSNSTATCTSGGQNVYVCTRCGDTRTEATGALGHAYQVTGETDATCTANGSRTSTCSRCGDTRTETISAFGHAYQQTAETAATCTKDGSRTSVCWRCGDELTETIPKLGHDYAKKTADPTCTKNGSETDTCKRCGDVKTKTIPALGHAWPDEWTVKTEPTLFDEGLEYRQCTRCGEREEQTIPRLSPLETPYAPGIIIGGIVVIAAIAFGVFRLLAARAAAAAAVEGAAAAAAGTAGGLGLIKLSQRKVFVKLAGNARNDEFLDILKSRPNISLTAFDPDADATLAEQIQHVNPDAVIVDFVGADELDGAMDTIQDLKAQHDGIKFEAIAFDANETALTSLAAQKETGALYAFAQGEQNKYVKMSRLIVPLYKNMMKDADSLEGVGIIADIFGIPAVSELLNLAANAANAGELAKTAKGIFAGADLKLADGVSIANNIAEIIGLDLTATLTDVAEGASNMMEPVHDDTDHSA